MLDDRLWIRVSQPLPGRGMLATYDDINPRRTRVTVSTQLNGGYASAEVGMGEPLDDLVLPHLPTPAAVVDKAHVEIGVGGFTIHEGVVQTTEEPGGQVMAFTSLGYGPAAGNWVDFDSDQEDEATQGTIIRAAVRQVPWWNLNRICPTAEVIQHGWSEFAGRSVAQLLEQVVREGNSDNDLFYWTVYEKRAFVFICKAWPDLPHYRISADTRVEVRRNYADIFDACRAKYEQDGTTGYTNWHYGAGVDRTSAYLRVKTLNTGTKHSSDAVQFAQTWIAANSAAKLSATLTLRSHDTLPSVTGAEVPGYRVRSGQWVEFEGYGMAQITQTRCDLMSGETTIQIGEPTPDMMGYHWGRLVASSEATRVGASPISWS